MESAAMSCCPSLVMASHRVVVVVVVGLHVEQCPAFGTSR